MTDYGVCDSCGALLVTEPDVNTATGETFCTRICRDVHDADVPF